MKTVNINVLVGMTVEVPEEYEHDPDKLFIGVESNIYVVKTTNYQPLGVDRYKVLEFQTISVESEEFYIYRGYIERGNICIDAYSRNDVHGAIYPYQSKDECLAEAKSKGLKAVFISKEDYENRFSLSQDKVDVLRLSAS